jgi:predicted  nucleic acid-binding Zn-ribbon protein
LFRGGGNEMSMPTSMPVIGGGENMMAAGPGDAGLRDQVSRLQSELAALQSQLGSAQTIKKDLESALATAQARIKELEAMLAAKPGGAPADNSAMVAEIQKITKERDDLREKLKEYEIIEDDLANLKRLQQENQQLKRSLGVSGGSAPIAASEETSVSGGTDPLAAAADLFEEVTEVIKEEDATAELEEFLAAGSEESSSESERAVEAALNESTPKAAANEKTPEDLLSEFEKMLG